MLSKEIKKLSRRELVDIIYQMKQNEQQMQSEIVTLQEKLQDKRLKLTKSGSIAEAAVEITQIFTNAQKTADIYLQEIICMKADTEHTCEQMIQEAANEANRIYLEKQKEIDALTKKIEILQQEIKKLEN